MMPSDGSVTVWIDLLKAGEKGSVEQKTWDRYFERLVAIARNRLRNAPKRIGDEEDAVLEATASFYERVKKGQFPDLTDRTDLWPLLVALTVRKAGNQIRWVRRIKRPPPTQP